MGATGALLGDVQIFVEVDDPVIGAGIHAQAATGALHRVDDDQSVLPLVEGALHRAGLYAGGLVTVHAQVGPVGHLHLGHGATDALGELEPELADVGLWFGDGGPVVGHVLVFADDLAVVAAVALGYVDDEDFLAHRYLPPSTHALKRRPEAES